MEAILIGYFPKRIERPEGWCPELSHVKAIYSASECISSGPDDWVKHCVHNAMCLFDDEDTGLSVVPRNRVSQFTLFAYKMLPCLFHEGEQVAFEFPRLRVDPIPRDYAMVGYDAVSRSGGDGFECAPLSCNAMAEKYNVNKYCLVDDVDDAIQMALAFSTGQCEPGPYCVVEVWKKGTPDL